MRGLSKWNFRWVRLGFSRRRRTLRPSGLRRAGTTCLPCLVGGNDNPSRIAASSPHLEARAQCKDKTRIGQLLSEREPTPKPMGRSVRKGARRSRLRWPIDRRSEPGKLSPRRNRHPASYPFSLGKGCPASQASGVKTAVRNPGMKRPGTVPTTGPSMSAGRKATPRFPRLGGKRGTGSVVKVVLALERTLPPRCLSPLSANLRRSAITVADSAAGCNTPRIRPCGSNR